MIQHVFSSKISDTPINETSDESSGLAVEAVLISLDQDPSITEANRDLTSSAQGLSCSAVIVRHPLIVSSQTKVAQVLDQMLSATTDLDHPQSQVRAGCVCVVKAKRLVGIFTEQDLLRLHQQTKPLTKLSISQVMQPVKVTLRESELTDTRIALELLQSHKIRYLPIIDDQERVVGLISAETLLPTLAPLPLAPLQSQSLAFASVAKQVMVRAAGDQETDLGQERFPKALTQIDLSETTLQEEGLPELFFSQSLDGCFFMMLDQPIFWDASTDKDQMIEYVFEHQRITRVNDALLRQYQATAERFIGFTPKDIFSHNLSEGKQIWKTFFDRGRLHIETNEKREDGSAMSIEGDYVCLYDPQGRIVGHFGIQRDVTEKKAAELALLKSEAKFRHLAENIPGMIYQYLLSPEDQDQFLYVSPRVQEIYGITDTTVMQDAKSIWAMVHPEDMPDLQIEVYTSARDLSPFVSEHRICTASGQIKWIQAIARPSLQADGKILWDGIATDITVRKKAELENTRLRQQLQLLFDHNQAVLFTCDPQQDYRTTFISENCHSLLGYSAQAWLADENLWINHIHPDDVPSVVQELFSLYENGNHTHEYRFRHQDGSYHWIHEGLQLIRDAEGNAEEVVGYFIDITERKQAELDLKKSQAQLSDILDSPIACVVSFHLYADSTWEYCYFSGGYSQVFGYTPAEIMENSPTYQSRVHPEDWEAKVLPLFLRFFNEELCQIEYRFYHKNGQLRWILAKYSSRYCHQNNCWVVTCINTDITDQKQIEILLQQLNLTLEQKVLERTQALQERETRYRALMDGAGDAIIVSDLQGNVLEVNRQAERLFGYSRMQLNQMHQLDLFPAQEDIGVLLYQVVEGNSLQIAESKILHRTGRIIPVDISIAMINIDERQIIQSIIRDTTERQESELIRQQLIQELSAFKFALDQSTMVTITDAQDVITYANDCFCDISGYSLAELLGNTPHLIHSGYHPPTFFENLWQSISSGQVWRGEMCNRSKAGHLYWVDTTIIPFVDEVGTPYQYLAICFDITAQKEAKDQLQQTNEALMRATQMKDEFLANMSHELRTPLNAILGMAESLQEEIFGCLNEAQLKAIHTVERSGNHLLELINDILDLAKIEAGQAELKLEAREPIALCQSSLAFVKQQAFKKKIQLETKFADVLPHLWVDERRIRQTLINLLSNAVKFTPAGGQILLEVSVVPHGLLPNQDLPEPQGYLQISITDTGIGIAPQDLEKLFQPFIQVDSALNRQYTGTGLGLALVKRIVELHGGYVSVTSEVGKGSCFKLALPYCYSRQEVNLALLQAGIVESAELDPALMPASQMPLLLLAEDNEANILTLSSYLEAKGYQLVLAKSGYQVLEILQTCQPDVILMDIQMPGMDGLATIEQIHQHPQWAGIPIIALTALAMNSDRDRCLAAGVHTYLSKPVKLKQLEQSIQQLL